EPARRARATFCGSRGARASPSAASRRRHGLTPREALLDQAHQLFAVHAESLGGVSCERCLCNARHELVRRAPIGAELDLKEIQIQDLFLTLESGGEGQKVRGDEGLWLEAAQHVE